MCWLLGFIVVATHLPTVNMGAAVVQTVLDSGRSGPTVLVVNRPGPKEVSGAVAIRQVSQWTLTSGRVVAATGADLAACIEATAPSAIVMLSVAGTTRSGLPHALFSGRGVDQAALRSRLSSLLDPGTAPLATGTPTLPPRAGLDRTIELAFVAQRGAPNPGERTRLFRHAVHEVLAALGMTSSSPWTLVNSSTGKIKAAIYAGGGSATTPGLFAYPACLDDAAGEIDYTFVGPVELDRPNLLDSFDVVIFCGGSGSGQARSLGETAASAVKGFVRRGGGYVSSCAGTYLATSGYSWSLKIIAADTVDSKHWARGSGPVDIELTGEGRKILGDFPGLQSIRYANGPLLGPAKDSGGLVPYMVLAHFRSDMARNAPGGVMPNTPAIIAGNFGEGRVICFSPHPEYTDALNTMVVRAVKWAAKRAE